MFTATRHGGHPPHLLSTPTDSEPARTTERSHVVGTGHLPRAVLPGALAVAMAVSACSAMNEQSTDTAHPPGTGSAGRTNELSGSITGAGASTQKVAQDAWTATFTGKQPGVSMNYSPIGSGGGTQRF